MKLLASLLLSFSLMSSINASAATKSAKQASKDIEAAVEAVKALAESGVSKYKVKPGNNVKEMLLTLAIKEYEISEEEFEMNWKENSADAWETDSANWAESTMKEAYSYIFDPPEMNDGEEVSAEETAKYKAAVKKGKEAFELLLNTGVMFGVAPLGAVQCGVRFAGLAIIDPHTGKIYVFAKEGSGC